MAFLFLSHFFFVLFYLLHIFSTFRTTDLKQIYIHIFIFFIKVPKTAHNIKKESLNKDIT